MITAGGYEGICLRSTQQVVQGVHGGNLMNKARCYLIRKGREITMSVPQPASFVEAVRKITTTTLRPWVLFRHGTFVGPLPQTEDAAVGACDILRAAGPIRIGSPGGDFKVYPMHRDGWPGWLVTFDHPKLATIVMPEELDESSPSPVRVGIFARGKRALDAKELVVVHVERTETPEQKL